MSKSPIAPSAEATDIQKPLTSPFYARHQDRIDARRNMAVMEEEDSRRALLKEVHATRLLRVSDRNTHNPGCGNEAG